MLILSPQKCFKMTVFFQKFQGAGNDFILIDDRTLSFDIHNQRLINFLCHRHFGIGADGLMLLRNHADYDFQMIYFNADGKEGSMCGNGGRCIVAFAHKLGIIKNNTRFLAVDGEHDASIFDNDGETWVSLKMIDVKEIEKGNDFTYLNTGSPHYVNFVDDLAHFPVVEQGKKVRYSERFHEEGTNVNFIEITGEKSLAIRTYERGVEDETLACGTGVTAAVLSAYYLDKVNGREINVQALGGKLKVTFEPTGKQFENIWLQGPAEFVFKGEINV